MDMLLIHTAQLVHEFVVADMVGYCIADSAQELLARTLQKSESCEDVR